MKKMVTGLVMSVPTVAPIFETRIIIASGTDTTSCSPNGIEHPMNIPSAQPAATDSGENEVAFAMEPVTVEEMMAIADAGAIMPPKSTWFEPKLRSGLFVHTV